MSLHYPDDASDSSNSTMTRGTKTQQRKSGQQPRKSRHQQGLEAQNDDVDMDKQVAVSGGGGKLDLYQDHMTDVLEPPPDK